MKEGLTLPADSISSYDRERGCRGCPWPRRQGPLTAGVTVGFGKAAVVQGYAVCRSLYSVAQVGYA